MASNQEIQQRIDQAKNTLAGIQAQAQPIINGQSLQPTTPIPYASPNPVPIPTTAGLDPLSPTPMEGQANSLDTRLQALNDSLVGKSAYQTSQEAVANIPDLTQRQSDLGTQLKQLQNEALAIPQQLQLDATGRGITAGGLAPIQAGRLRTNAIAALGVSSLLDATNGLLSSAQQKADRAVAAKYDPIQEQIDAASKNLNLILNSPQYSLEQKNRAQAQLATQNAKQAKLDQNKEDSKTIMSWAAAALQNGASTVQAQQLMQLAQGDAPNLQAAFQLYAPYAKDPNATQKALLDLQQQRADIAGTQANTQKTLASIGGTGSGSGSGVGGAVGTTGNASVDATAQGYTTNLVGGTGLTQSAIDQAALSFALTGQLPTGARASTGQSLLQATAIKNRAAELNTGGNVQGNKAQLAAQAAALKEQTSYLNTTQRAFNTANDTLDALVSWMQQNGINASQFPDYNSFANFLKSKGIDPGAAGGYKAQIATLRAEYSQVLAKGGVRSVETDQAAAKLIPDGLSPAQLQVVANRIKIDGQNVVNDAQKQVQQIQDNINKIIAPPPSSTTTAPKVVPGIPPNIAATIQANLDAGNSLEEIRQGLAGEFGKKLGYSYLDKYMTAK
jgi:hypothetical protein